MNRKIILAFFAALIFFAAQAQTKARFVEYASLPEQIMTSLIEAQAEQPYASLESLRAISAKALDSKSLELKDFAKPAKKTMSAPELVSSVREGSLMVCKYKRGFGAYDDFILVGATAVAISDDGLCVTNYHVMQAIVDQGQGMNPQDSLMFVADLNGKTYEIERVLAYNQTADLAVLKVDTNKSKLSAFKLGDDAVVGQHVNTLTHPEGMPFYYSEGVVACNATYDGDQWENRTEITADFGVGSSGGPVFDDYGNLVAIVSSTQGVYAENQQGRDLQMVIKMTIPVSSLKRLLQ
ncbi:serine protease [uncultured Sunxiuqinia sp.]|uniref:S1 family peptidase n=1 Tax=uncultured Sunxiuqinia sp. TaxID=1573825 RepID=UPI002AA83FD2|nr:serine protease [uncultured Sunxiuqinia sp.]